MASRGDTIDKAIALKSDDDVVARLRQKMPDALKWLEDIACGNVPRNAAVQLKAIETMLRFSQPLPKTTIEHQGSVGIAVVDPYAEKPAIDGEAEEIHDARPEVKALPAPAAVAPIRRRKAKTQEPTP